MSTAITEAMIYANQTAILSWLKSLGHRVQFVRDYGAGRPERRRASRKAAGLPEMPTVAIKLPQRSFRGRHRKPETPIPVTSALHAFVGKPCPYCGLEMQTSGPLKASRDHKHPRCRGGTLGKQNKLVCCVTCNGDKGAKTIDEWLEKLKKHGDPRAERVGWIFIAEVKGRAGNVDRGGRA